MNNFYEVWATNHKGGLRIYQGYNFLRALHEVATCKLEFVTLRLYMPDGSVFSENETGINDHK